MYRNSHATPNGSIRLGGGLRPASSVSLCQKRSLALESGRTNRTNRSVSATTCNYKKRDETPCGREVHPSYDKCIFHVDFPPDDQDECDELGDLKETEFLKKIHDKEFDFEGARLRRVIFPDDVFPKNPAQIEGHNLDFYDAIIEGDVKCNDKEVYGPVNFEGAEIRQRTLFNRTIIHGHVYFSKAILHGNVRFNKATISESVHFDEAIQCGHIYFDGASLKSNVSFDRASINGSGISLDFEKIDGNLSFKKTKFKDPKYQEKSCRRARRTNANTGSRDDEDYHFFREMEAKRKQKKLLVRYLELPIQYVIWYWVYPFRVFCSFIGFVVAFGILFWLIAGQHTLEALWSNLRFSFLTLFNPISGIENAGSGLYGTITIVAGLIGIFTWPVFIASLAKKYGR